MRPVSRPCGRNKVTADTVRGTCFHEVAGENKDRLIGLGVEMGGNRSSWREVRVFGSRATGHARRASDLDLAVFAPDATAGEWAEICEALENAPLIYELDLVRAERMTPAGLKEKIEREGIAIYP